MSKYKVGDKFVCEIKEVIECERGTLYRSNFSTLVFDDYGLDNLIKLPDDIITKLKEREDDKKIKEGDVVAYVPSGGKAHGIVLDIANDMYQVMWSNRAVSWEEPEYIYKTDCSLKIELEEILGELERKQNEV